MTSNQLKYWELTEKARSNRANEAIQSRYNDSYLSEFSRHNVRSEDLTQFNYAEMKRHNVATEGISRKQADAEVNYKDSLTLKADTERRIAQKMQPYQQAELASVAIKNYAAADASRSQVSLNYANTNLKTKELGYMDSDKFFEYLESSSRTFKNYVSSIPIIGALL